MSDLGKLYQDAILAHHKAPRHAAALSAPTHRAEGNNPLCGDRVVLTLEVGQGRVLDVGCEVKGCAICRASGSMLAEAIAGGELSHVVSLGERFLDALSGAGLATSPAADVGPGLLETQPRFPTGTPRARRHPARDGAGADAGETWGPLGALLEARRHPNRLRCATLPWEALQRALRVP